MTPLDSCREYLNQALEKLDADKDPTFQIKEAMRFLDHLEKHIQELRNKWN